MSGRQVLGARSDLGAPGRVEADRDVEPGTRSRTGLDAITRLVFDWLRAPFCTCDPTTAVPLGERGVAGSRLPPPRKPGAWTDETWRNLRIVGGRVCGAIFVIALLLFTGYAVVANSNRYGGCGRNRRASCQRNLEELGTLFVVLEKETNGHMPYDGVSLFLSFRAKNSWIKKKQEALLICPGDNQAIMPTTPEQQDAYDEIDLSNPRNNMCSYAVRDFTRYPLFADCEEPQIIACDRQGLDGRTAHHDNGLCVLFDDGSVRFMSRGDLGLARDDPIVVGPGSNHPMLSKVVSIPGR